MEFGLIKVKFQDNGKQLREYQRILQIEENRMVKDVTEEVEKIGAKIYRKGNQAQVKDREHRNRKRKD